MKKNKIMRLAGVLLIAVLLTTSIISGTFAKYVTTGSVTDSARVAKFGVQVTAGGELFSKTYVNQAGGNTPGTGVGSETITVESASDKLVAPGTQSSANGLGFSISGTPEVATAVTITAAYVDNEDIFLKAGTYTDVTGAGDKFTLSSNYNPIVWTLTKNGSVVNDCQDVSLTAINSYFSTQATNGALSFNPNKNLASTTDGMGAYKLTWKWAFGDSTNNKADTVLGDLAAKTPEVKGGTNLDQTLEDGTDYNLDIKVKITITVAQVD